MKGRIVAMRLSDGGEVDELDHDYLGTPRRKVTDEVARRPVRDSVRDNLFTVTNVTFTPKLLGLTACRPPKVS